MRDVIVLFTILFILTSGEFVTAKPYEPQVIKPYAEDWYVTPEDII